MKFEKSCVRSRSHSLYSTYFGVYVRLLNDAANNSNNTTLNIWGIKLWIGKNLEVSCRGLI